MKKTVIVIAVVFFGLFILSSIGRGRMQTQQRTSSGITYAQFDLLKTGQTYDQVAAILGSPGEETHRNVLGEGTQFRTETVSYSWKGNKFASSLSVIFQNGALTSKTQFGLK